MTSAFILTLDVGDDTDLLGVADDVQQLVDGEDGLKVISCVPYSHPTLGIGAPTIPGLPPPPPNPLGGS